MYGTYDIFPTSIFIPFPISIYPIYLPQNYQKIMGKGTIIDWKVPWGWGAIYGDMWSFPRRVSPLPALITEAGPPPTRKPYKENLEDFKAMQAPKGWKIHGKPPWVNQGINSLYSCFMKGPYTSYRVGLPKTYGAKKMIKTWLIQRNWDGTFTLQNIPSLKLT